MYHMMSSFPSIENMSAFALKLVKIYTGVHVFDTICKIFLLAFIWYYFQCSLAEFEERFALKSIVFLMVDLGWRPPLEHIFTCWPYTSIGQINTERNPKWQSSSWVRACIRICYAIIDLKIWSYTLL